MVVISLFQVKNGLTRSLLVCFFFVFLFVFFLKMPKIWVGRTTPNGEKTGRALLDGQTTSWSSYNLELVNIWFRRINGRELPFWRTIGLLFFSSR